MLDTGRMQWPCRGKGAVGIVGRVGCACVTNSFGFRCTHDRRVVECFCFQYRTRAVVFRSMFWKENPLKNIRTVLIDVSTQYYQRAKS